MVMGGKEVWTGWRGWGCERGGGCEWGGWGRGRERGRRGGGRKTAVLRVVGLGEAVFGRFRGVHVHGHAGRMVGLCREAVLL